MFHSRPQQAFNPDKENPHLHAKTPGRNILGPKSTQISRQYPQTGGGGKLAPGTSRKQAPATVFKDVNLLATGRKLGGTSGGGKNGGKGQGEDDDVAKLLFKEAGPSKSISKTPAFKTPFANKLQPSSSRVPALATPLPSAQRARRKSRQSQTHSSPAGLSSHGSVDTSLHNLLNTPARGDLLGPPGGFITPERAHRSPSQLSVGDVSFEDLAQNSVVLENLVEEDEESDVEIEYMPPKVVRESRNDALHFQGSRPCSELQPAFSFIALEDAPPFDFIPLKQLGEQFMAAKGRLPTYPDEPGEIVMCDLNPTDEELGAGWTDEWKSGLKIMGESGTHTSGFVIRLTPNRGRLNSKMTSSLFRQRQAALQRPPTRPASRSSAVRPRRRRRTQGPRLCLCATGSRRALLPFAAKPPPPRRLPGTVPGLPR